MILKRINFQQNRCSALANLCISKQSCCLFVKYYISSEHLKIEIFVFKLNTFENCMRIEVRSPTHIYAVNNLSNNNTFTLD